MKKLLFLMLAMATIQASFAQTDEEPANGAEISFEQKTIDYGTIYKGSDGSRMFVLENTGNEPLIITECTKSCGCTVPKCPKDPVMPGEVAEIKVTYDTKRVGNFTKYVTVKSNATNGNIQLTIKGKVKDEEDPNATQEEAGDSSGDASE